MEPALREPTDSRVDLKLEDAKKISGAFENNKRIADQEKRAPKKRRPAHVKGQMNKTEARFAALLQARFDAGEFSEFAFEPFALPIEGGYTYAPDFVAIPRNALFTIADLKRLAQTTAMAMAASQEFYGLVSLFQSAVQARKGTAGPLACLFEVKGAMIWEKNRQKFKQARERYPWARFEMHQWKAGEWKQLLTQTTK